MNGSVDGETAVEQPRNELRAVATGIAIKPVEQTYRLDVDVIRVVATALIRHSGSIRKEMRPRLVSGLQTIQEDGATA